ncbi:MAG: hypothetical protein LT102_04805 [Burkholderiaceae bacterium]|nr:hypothetical protein [Burkholderiaceae bacterium]
MNGPDLRLAPGSRIALLFSMESLVAAIGVAGASVAIIFLLRRGKRRGLQEALADECVVSECGPDGTPLSLYAG